MPALPGDNYTGTLGGGGLVLTGSWRRFLLKNLDTVNTIGIKINNETVAYPVDPLGNHGDVYGGGPGITRVELVNQGGTPLYALKLHY